MSVNKAHIGPNITLNRLKRHGNLISMHIRMYINLDASMFYQNVGKEENFVNDWFAILPPEHSSAAFTIDGKKENSSHCQ